MIPLEYFSHEAITMLLIGLAVGIVVTTIIFSLEEKK